jgi:non-canonical (house-cleaning) NTP pyrophosphatase
MPLTEHHILEGACRRAQALLSRAPAAADAWLAIGVEAGFDPLPVDHSRYALKTWVAATDGRQWGYGAGGAFVVPDRIARAVMAGAELGDVIDELAGAPVRGTRGAWGVVTRDLVGRRDAFEIAVLGALAPFYHPALFSPE